MLEPEHDKYVRDSDGYRWYWDESNNGWSLSHFECILAYVGLKWSNVVRDYGPMRLDI